MQLNVSFNSKYKKYKKKLCCIKKQVLEPALLSKQTYEDQAMTEVKLSPQSPSNAQNFEPDIILSVCKFIFNHINHM